MYRVSPFTYLVSGVLSVGLANSHISCSKDELLRFSPPPLTKCSTYLSPYIELHSGYLQPDSLNSITECVFCTGSDTNVFLKSVSSEYQHRWRNWGIFLVYVVFNIAAAMGLYWLARVPKGNREKNNDISTDNKSKDVEKRSSGSTSPSTME
jgi:ATP-binding cassette subfamily G (WHITE) protein 2 (PDR)